MVFIVTGSINSGKTKKLLSIYRQLGEGDGFISQKILNDKGETVGYDLMRLLNKERVPFIYLKSETPTKWSEEFQYDKFSFSSIGLNYANNLIDSLLINEAPIFIDEIGPVELQNKGFDLLLKKVLKSETNVHITVRDIFVKDIVEKYKIRSFFLIDAIEYINGKSIDSYRMV